MRVSVRRQTEPFWFDPNREGLEFAMSQSEFITAAVNAATNDKVVCLSLNCRPASVRDSMCRAEAVVDELCSRRTIKEKTRVCVIGTGPVGMTVVAKCLKAGAEVVAMDSRDHLQVRSGVNSSQPRMDVCTKRVICPTTFDFPRSHWLKRRFPIAQGNVAEFPWLFGPASDVVRAIRKSYLAICAANPNNFTSYPESDWTYPKPSKGGVAITFRFPVGMSASLQRESKLKFDLVFVAIGLGRHTQEVDGSKFSSFAYWSNDDPLLAATAENGRKRVLIAGGSDGGTQDFCRLVTGYSDSFAIIDAIGQKFTKAETDGLGRLSSDDWKRFALRNPVSDHARLEACHSDLTAFCDDVWRSNRDVREQCARLIGDNQRRPSVQLSFRCSHFDTTYFANRVSCQLLARAMAEDPQLNGGFAPFIINSKVVSVNSVDSAHCCTGDPHDCAGYRHEVGWLPEICKDADKHSVLADRYVTATSSPKWMRTIAAPVARAVYDRVLIRFGSSLRSTAGVPDKLGDLVESTPQLRDVLGYYTTDFLG
jgi:hypothetical protein